MFVQPQMSKDISEIGFDC